MLIKSPIIICDENKAYVVGIHLEHLTEVLQMSTHNICFVFMKEKEKCYVDSHFIWSSGIHTGLSIYNTCLSIYRLDCQYTDCFLFSSR